MFLLRKVTNKNTSFADSILLIDWNHFVFQSTSYSEIKEFHLCDSLSTAHVSRIKSSTVKRREPGMERAWNGEGLF
jgi:hypothetical protein